MNGVIYPHNEFRKVCIKIFFRCPCELTSPSQIQQDGFNLKGPTSGHNSHNRGFLAVTPYIILLPP